jgi:hypothetical protein
LLTARAMRRILFFLSLVTACGSTEPTTAVAASRADAGATDDAAVGQPFTPEGRANIGTVMIAAMKPSTLYADVVFQDFSTPSGETMSRFRGETWKATDCKQHVVGACEMIACGVVTTPPVDTTGMLAGLSAGTITVTRANGDELVLEPDSNNRYVGSAHEIAPISDGEKVTVAVTGSEQVPAFTETVALTGAQRLTTSEVDVANGADAEITWTGSKTGRVVLVSGIGDLTAGRVGDVTCRFDAAPGRGTIPAALLAVVPKKTLTFVVVRDSTTKKIGGAEVTLTGALGDPFAAGEGYEVEVRLR